MLLSSVCSPKYADIAQLAERDLAKVEAADSNSAVRSIPQFTEEHELLDLW